MPSINQRSFKVSFKVTVFTWYGAAQNQLFSDLNCIKIVRASDPSCVGPTQLGSEALTILMQLNLESASDVG